MSTLQPPSPPVPERTPRTNKHAGICVSHPHFSPIIGDMALLETELAAMTKFRDECERQFQEKVAQLAAMTGERDRLVLENVAALKMEAHYRNQLTALRAERDKLRDELKDLKRSISCENMDPSGTIWDHADKVQKENAKLRDEVGRLAGDVRLLRAANNGLADECNRLSGEHDRASQVEEVASLRSRLSTAQQDGDALAEALEAHDAAESASVEQIVKGECPDRDTMRKDALALNRHALAAHREGKKGGES